jgi:hypothetical protein
MHAEEKAIHDRSIHVFFMQELYFEAFISFAALFFIHERLKLQPVLFTILIRSR